MYSFTGPAFPGGDFRARLRTAFFAVFVRRAVPARFRFTLDLVVAIVPLYGVVGEN
jgi:hypothetical protein